MRTEWTSREKFAEVAEALGIETDEVMAATAIEGGRGAGVLYTTGTDELDTAVVHQVILERDDNGIFQVVRHREVGPLRAWMDKAGLGELS